MAANGPRKQLALDTNVLFNLADGRDLAHAFREAFLAGGYALRFPPTVLEELVTAELEGDEHERRLATAALNNVAKWQIRLRVANSYSRGDWQLGKPVAVRL